MAKHRFGISTQLFRGERLCRDHLLAIAAHGFEVVELFAISSHFACGNVNAVADLQQWLAEAGLELYGIHQPIAERYEAGRWLGPLSIASTDAGQRAKAVGAAEQALHVARRIPVKVFVMHLGHVRATGAAAHADDPRPPDSRVAARRSIEEIGRTAGALGVGLAVEVIPNELSRAGSLVHFIEHDLEGLNVGICLDFGHAHLDGDLVEAIETVAEHLVSTHVHDNQGRQDDHLVPLEGTIDWASALTAVQKVGYEGPLMLEIVSQRPARDTLARARKARERMERMLS